MQRPFHFPSTLTAAACLAVVAGAQAQGVATERQLQPVVVTGTAARGGLDRDLPSTTASKSGEELREQQNIFNPEDALRNLPNTTIRKRYSGDRNALIGGAASPRRRRRAGWC